jgi:hypothetical protein
MDLFSSRKGDGWEGWGVKKVGRAEGLREGGGFGGENLLR